MMQRRILPYLSVLTASWLWVSAGCDRSPRPEGDSKAPAGVSEQPQEDPKKDAAVQRPAARAKTAANSSDKPTVESSGKPPRVPAPSGAADPSVGSPDSGQSVETEVRRLYRPDRGLGREWHVKILPDGTEVKHGRWTAYHSNGEIRDDGNYVNGKRDGKWASRHPSGKLYRTGRFELGKKVGTWTLYHENGQKRAEYSFVDGSREGTYTVWNEDGNVMEQGEYVRDRKDGTWITVDTSGNKIETHWDNGELRE